MLNKLCVLHAWQTTVSVLSTQSLDGLVARNIEIKAVVSDFPKLEAKVRELATEGPTLIEQDDTFFNCPNGRLKLRQFGADSCVLIFYVRANVVGPKTSHYLRSHSSNPESLREALHQAYGSIGRVVKTRTLFLVGRTRVHLDNVIGLGQFMELEVVLDEAEDPEVGVREANDLMAKFGISPDSLLEDAYLDLFHRKAAQPVVPTETALPPG